jgi:integrase/recombinase XerD
MSKSLNIALPIRRFFEDHLVSQRGLSPNTILSYRDTLKLLLQFAAQHCRKSCTDLTMDDLTPNLVRQFLAVCGKTRVFKKVNLIKRCYRVKQVANRFNR